MKRRINFNSLKRIFGIRQGIKSSSEKQDNYIIDGNALSENQVAFDTSVSTSKIIASVLIVFFAVILQEAFFNDFRIFGTKPEIALIVVLIISSITAPRFSILYGLFSGLFIDVIYGKYLGLYALLFMYFAIIASTVVMSKFKGKYIYTAIILLPVLFVYCLAEGFFARLLTIYSSEHTILYYNFGAYFFKRLLPEVMYDFILLLVLLAPILILWKRIGRKNREIKWKA